MKLFFRELGDGEPLIIMHGLFGLSDNWMSIGRDLAEKYHIFLVDMRNHGQSPHSDFFNYEVMAADIQEFMLDNHIWEAVLMGHSMGGKVAMTLAQQFPLKVKKLIVVDIAPKSYQTSFFEEILEHLKSIDISKVKSREEIDEQLAEKISDPGIRQFLLKNVARKDKHSFEWKINLEGVKKNLSDIVTKFPGNKVFKKPTLFIKGEKSDYITSEDYPTLKKMFPNAEIVTIANASHWLHVEAPEAFLEKVHQFLDQ
ncbi:MAG: alpha/beta fold hydrolase [Calditrichae bacterium]|nr:alpha/beta fold hydrolase [Calditrichia bacterium]NIW78181.1 alpha/beta fold hydrolase [Calditrichia bacterium]